MRFKDSWIYTGSRIALELSDNNPTKSNFCKDIYLLITKYVFLRYRKSQTAQLRYAPFRLTLLFHLAYFSLSVPHSFSYSGIVTAKKKVMVTSGLGALWLVFSLRDVLCVDFKSWIHPSIRPEI